MTNTLRTKQGTPIIPLPKTFSFIQNGITEFDSILSLFKWNYSNTKIIIDGNQCKHASYQTLTLLILYLWTLKQQKTFISIQFPKHSTLDIMWNRLDGPNYLSILNNSQNNFHYVYNKPLFAIKYKDHNITQMLNTIRDYAMDLPTDLIRGYEDAVRYIISELTYNALEHGFNPQIPSLLQFNWYRDKNQLSFILADLGVGIKTHLEQTYAPFTSNTDAIAMALEPEISGTFGVNVGPSNKTMQAWACTCLVILAKH